MKKSKEELEAKAYQPQSNELDKKITKGLIGKKEKKYVSDEKKEALLQYIERLKKEQEVKDYYTENIKAYKQSIQDKFKECADDVVDEIEEFKDVIRVVYSDNVSSIEVAGLVVRISFMQKETIGLVCNLEVVSSELYGHKRGSKFNIVPTEDKRIVARNNADKEVELDVIIEDFFVKVFGQE